MFALDSNTKKGVYHLNDLKVWVPREDRLCDPFGEDKQVPATNEEVKRQLASQGSAQKALRKMVKESMDGVLEKFPVGTDPDMINVDEIKEPLQIQVPEGYGDEPWVFWRNREVNLQSFLANSD